MSNDSNSEFLELKPDQEIHNDEATPSATSDTLLAKKEQDSPSITPVQPPSPAKQPSRPIAARINNSHKISIPLKQSSSQSSTTSSSKSRTEQDILQKTTANSESLTSSPPVKKVIKSPEPERLPPQTSEVSADSEVKSSVSIPIITPPPLIEKPVSEEESTSEEPQPDPISVPPTPVKSSTPPDTLATLPQSVQNFLDKINAQMPEHPAASSASDTPQASPDSIKLTPKQPTVDTVAPPLVDSFSVIPDTTPELITAPVSPSSVNQPPLTPPAPEAPAEVVTTPEPVVSAASPLVTADVALDNQVTQPSFQTMPKVKTSFTLFTLFTFVFIVGTLVWLLVIFSPQIKNLFQSQASQEIGKFETVLGNLLQTDNQTITISLEDVRQISPSSVDSQNIDSTRIKLVNSIDLQYLAHAPGVSAFNDNFKFDIDLRNPTRQANILLDVTTYFDDGEAVYFKINSFCINDCNDISLAGEYLEDWSNFNILLSRHSQLVNSGEESDTLDYVVNLLPEYSSHHYVRLLPVFNISDSQQYHKLQQALVDSGTYQLDIGSCQTLAVDEIECDLTINYDSLDRFYQEVYGNILAVDFPRHLTSFAGQDLPTQFKLTYDTKNNLPLKLMTVDGNLSIEYNQFNNRDFTLIDVDTLVDIDDYYRRILEGEDSIYYSNN